MATTYLFSNCKKSSNDEFLVNIKNLNITPNDTLVFLNEGYLLYPFMDYFKELHIHLIMRQCGMYGLIGFFGFNKAFDQQKHFISINTLAIANNDMILTRGYRATNASTVIRKTCPWIADYKTKTMRDPTTGYAAYHIINDIFNTNEDDIKLVNFYGNEDNSTGKCKDHAWDFENEWLKSRKRIFC